jgi:uncharacterized membrane-anchored protein
MMQLIRSRQPKRPLPWWQKRALTISIVVLGLLAILITINFTIIKYERHLATGNTLLLELAPVDPRGFMQGDYMALSYALETEIFAALTAESRILQPASSDWQPDLQLYKPSEGYVIVKVDEHNVGHFLRLADDINQAQLAVDERAIYYRIRNNSVLLATNAFFFQEGQSQAFEAAEYGLFRVNAQGEPLLTELVDGKFKVIEGKSNKAAAVSD